MSPREDNPFYDDCPICCISTSTYVDPPAQAAAVVLMGFCFSRSASSLMIASPFSRRSSRAWESHLCEFQNKSGFFRSRHSSSRALVTLGAIDGFVHCDILCQSEHCFRLPLKSAERPMDVPRCSACLVSKNPPGLYVSCIQVVSDLFCRS